MSLSTSHYFADGAPRLLCTAMRTPIGRWVLVGVVPACAGYERKDGAPLTDDDIRACNQFLPGIAACRTKSYFTEAAALAAAIAAGG